MQPILQSQGATSHLHEERGVFLQKACEADLQLFGIKFLQQCNAVVGFNSY